MIQKCSLLNVLTIFFKEPTSIHFVREIGKKIKLAPTSVRNNIKYLLKIKLIKTEKSKPFNGYIANRDNEDFLFYKKLYNLYTLNNFKRYLVEVFYPRLIVVFGSYALGEDVEESDIDILIISKSKSNLNLERFEKLFGKNINVIVVSNLNKLDKNIQKKVFNGVVLYGGFDE